MSGTPTAARPPARPPAFDASRGWTELGHGSLFAFLHVQLRLPKASAYHRAAAARLAGGFPAVADALRAGRLCLTSTAELAKVLAPENEAAVLPRFFGLSSFGLSSREAKELVAELLPCPAPPTREVVTAASPRRVESVRAHEPTPASTPREQAGPLFACSSRSLPEPSAAPARPPDGAVPLTAGLSRLHVTVSRRFLEKLASAKAVRSHARPGATAEAPLEEALDLLLEREEKRRAAATARPT